MYRFTTVQVKISAGPFVETDKLFENLYESRKDFRTSKTILKNLGEHMAPDLKT